MFVRFDELFQELKRVLLKLGFTIDKAELCARIFSENSRDGVHSHGLNRFPDFVKTQKGGFIKTDTEPVKIGYTGLIEHWDGQLAPGMYTATLAMSRAIELAKEFGIGCVTVRNTNHWMRGGTYGWQAADAGCISICTTNAIANMPAWGGNKPTLGNNPVVISIPRKEGHIVLDMALSQFSYGKLNEYKMSKKELPVPGGYNEQGELTTDPAAIMASMRPLPIGYWKGSGLSLAIDLLVTILSGGKSVAQISKEEFEHGVSQLFLCLSPARVDDNIIEQIIEFTKSSGDPDTIRYPGEGTLAIRRKSEKEGIPVNDEIWSYVKSL